MRINHLLRVSNFERREYNPELLVGGWVAVMAVIVAGLEIAKAFAS